jgi:hypothetical protein
VFLESAFHRLAQDRPEVAVRKLVGEERLVIGARPVLRRRGGKPAPTL